MPQPVEPATDPNTLGIRPFAFSVDDIDAAVARLRDRGLELLGEVVRYEDIYRLCYVRGPEGILGVCMWDIAGGGMTMLHLFGAR